MIFPKSVRQAYHVLQKQHSYCLMMQRVETLREQRRTADCIPGPAVKNALHPLLPWAVEGATLARLLSRFDQFMIMLLKIEDILLLQFNLD
jgi:hypothetical protein